MPADLVLPSLPGENPAAVAAMGWLRFLETDRFDLAWAALTPEFRLYIIQDWIVQNPGVDHDPSRAGMDRDELAAALSVAEPTHPLWHRGAARVAERGLRGAASDFLTEGEWGAGERVRPVGPGLELVRIFPHSELTRDERGELVFPAGGVAEVLSVLMLSMSGGWKVAGLSWLPRPGWPPQIEMVAQLED